MEMVESPPIYTIENFIQSCTGLSDVCFEAEDLTHLGKFCLDVKETLKVQGDLSTGMKHLLNNDTIFQQYLPPKLNLTTVDYSVGIENIVTDIFKAICNFFKRLVTGLWDFIKKVFGLQKTTSEVNAKNLKLLKPYYDKYRSRLDEIPASSSIPTYKLASGTLDTLQTIILHLTKMDINRLHDQIHSLVQSDTSVSKIEVDYSVILGKNYVADLKNIGITFIDEVPVFESIYTNISTSSTIGKLGYDYHSLTELNRILMKSIVPLKSQMEKIVKSLDKISNELVQISHKVSKEESSAEKYKEILETLPQQITRLVGLFQKISLAVVTYETKTSDIIRCIYEDFRSFGDK